MKNAVLVGAGHAHRRLIKDYGQALRESGVALSLVAPSSFWYGGAVTALLAGALGRHALRCGLREWSRESRFALYRDRAVGLDRRRQRLWLASGQTLSYDAVSLNVGYEPASARDSPIPLGAPRLWPATSVAALARLRDVLIDDGARRPVQRVAVAGHGRRAAEVAAGLCLLDAPIAVGLYIPGPRMLPDAPAGVGRRLVKTLAERGVDIVFETPITGRARRAIVARDGRYFAADHWVAADSARAARLVYATGLPADGGGLHVGGRLYSPRDGRVFAVGGCMRRAGVAAARPDDSPRQASILAHNLIARFSTRPYRDYRATPRRQWLDIGDGRKIVWGQRFWRETGYPARTRDRDVAGWTTG